VRENISILPLAELCIPQVDCQLVLILNYQKLFAIFESFALSAASEAGNKKTGRKDWRRLVLQATCIPLAQIPRVLL